MRTATFLLLLAASTFADVFKEKVKIGKKTCLCTFSLIADGTKLSPESTANCDKKCSGVAKKVSIEGARGVFTFDMMVKRGKVTLLRGEFLTPTAPSGSTRPTPTPPPYTTPTTPSGPSRPTPGTEVCASGFTRVCPMMDDRCPPGTEKICPKGMEVDTKQALNRHDGGSSGCQCIPDFLISLMKRNAVDSRLSLVLAPDVFTDLKIKMGKRTCTCTLSLLADGTRLSPKSEAVCDKKCSGAVKRVVLTGRSGNVYTLDITARKGKARLKGTVKLAPVTTPPSPIPTPSPVTKPGGQPEGPSCSCVEIKTGSAPTVITNITLTEGNETVVQTNNYQGSIGFLELIVPAHRNYTDSVFQLHEASKTSLVKSNNTCELAALELPVEGMTLADAASAFGSNAEMNQTTQFFLKARQARLGSKEREKLLPQFQSLCEHSQVVTTEDFEVNETEYEKYKRGEVIFVTKPRSTKDTCTEHFACSTQGPAACTTLAFIPPGQTTGFTFHTVSDGSVCVACNIITNTAGLGLPCLNPGYCLCSDLVNKNSVYACSIQSGVNTTIELQNLGRSTDYLVQHMTFNQDPAGVSITVSSPSHQGLNSVEVVMHAAQNGWWQWGNMNNYLIKIGTDCHISTLPLGVYPYDIAIGIQEIKKGNNVTIKADEKDEHKILLDAGPLATEEENALHPDIKTRCLGSTPKKFSEAYVTKSQSDKLREGKVLFLDPISSGQLQKPRGEPSPDMAQRDKNSLSQNNTSGRACTLKIAATTNSSGCWRWPNPVNSTLWINEMVHSVVDLTCCTSSDSCCADNYPQFCQCEDVVDSSTFNQCRKDQTPVVLVATGQTLTAAMGSVEILTRTEFGNYTQRYMEIDGKCSYETVQDFPKETTLGTGALFNGLPYICEGFTPVDQGGDCYGLRTDGSWGNKFELERPLAFGGYSVAFENLVGLMNPWLIVGGDGNGKLTEVWGGQPPSEMFVGEFQLPKVIKSPCITRISDDEAFVTAIPRNEVSDTNFAWIFNIRTNNWRRIDDTLHKRSGPACGFIQTPSGRFVVLAGGSGKQSTEILNLETLAWSDGPSLDDNIEGGRMVSVSNELILIGGMDQGPVGTIWRMNSSMKTWDAVGSLNGPRFNAVAMAVRPGDLPPLCEEKKEERI